MKTKGSGGPRTEKGLVRALVRRGSVDDRSPAAARETSRLRGTTMCERCGSIYRAKRWLRPTPEERQWPVGLAWTVCPACRQAREGEYHGLVLIHGGEGGPDEETLRRRMENVAARAQWTQPQRRILGIEHRGDDLEVYTTSQKLAHRITRSLRSAFGGSVSYGWSDRDGELRATWRWEGRPSPRGPARAAKAVRRPGTIDLEIQGHQTVVDLRCRDLIEGHAAEWAERFPEVLRVHATLHHGRHHRLGADRIALVANYPGHVLRVEKSGEQMVDAVHAGLLAMERELRRAQDARRRITKTPGARPQGSIKRIFRDAGYGFILLDRGREAYFHRDSLDASLRFTSLRPGMPVEVELEEGREGLQASRVFPPGGRRRV